MKRNAAGVGRPNDRSGSWRPTIAVGTIDQALLGSVRVKHAQMRSACLSRSLLVVDEVHASDAYMTGLLKNLLKQHLRSGGEALLLSATLGGEARTGLMLDHAVRPAPSEQGPGLPEEDSGGGSLPGCIDLA